MSGDDPIQMEPERVTVEQAVQNWLAHRAQDGKKNEKARLVSDKLQAFCREQSILFLSTITRPHLNAFKLTLPFRSGNSNSLRVHLSILGGFFRWADDEAEYLAANPFPKFKIEFQREEITPPTAAEINRVLAIESVRLFGSLMRWSGMAILDTVTLKRDALVGNLIRSRRCKTSAAQGYRCLLSDAFEKAGVKMTTHHFVIISSAPHWQPAFQSKT